MKNIIIEKFKTRWTAAIALGLIMAFSCTENKYDLWNSASAGYLVNIDAADSYISGTYDLGTRTITYDSVYLYVAYDFPAITTTFDQIVVRKSLYSESDVLMATQDIAVVTELPTSLEVYYETAADLFDDFPFSPDSLKTSYYFTLSTIMYLPNGDSITTTSGNYEVATNLTGFCPLPTLPVGIWTAKNNETSFSKDVIIRNPSPYAEDDEGRYWLSDFGLDWSNWSDMWYTIEFTLECPRGDNDNQYYINLVPGGSDPGTDLTSVDRTGVTVTKSVRIMPYQYDEDTEAYGYFDTETQQLVFSNVSVVDSWWNSDNHTVDLVFKYKGPE